MWREPSTEFKSTPIIRTSSTSPRPGLHPDDMPGGQPPSLPTTTRSSTAREQPMEIQMPSPADQTTIPLPSPPFPFSPDLPPIPFIILPTSLPPPSWSLQTIPSCPRLQQPRQPTSQYLHSFKPIKRGLAGSQTPHCQLASLRAGRQWGSSACRRAYSTLRDAFLSLLPLLP